MVLGVAKRSALLQVFELVVSTGMESADVTTDIIACVYVMNGSISMPSRCPPTRLGPHGRNILQRRNASCRVAIGRTSYGSCAQQVSAAGLVCMSTT
jgi:hypothetical protein